MSTDNNVLEIRDSLAATITMVYDLMQQLTTDEDVIDEVQGHINRMMEIVKNLSKDAKVKEIPLEVDVPRKERRERQKKEKKDKEKKDVTPVVPAKTSRSRKKTTAVEPDA